MAEKKKKKKKQVIVLTSAEQFAKAVTLMNSTGCIFRIDDKYNVYVKLTKEFERLKKLSETEPFEGSEMCDEYKAECEQIAKELEPQLPAEKEVYDRTVTTSAKEKMQNEGKKKHFTKAKVVGILVLVIIVALVGCYMYGPTKYYMARTMSAVGLGSYAKGMYDELGNYKDCEERVANITKKELQIAKKGSKISFGNCKWIVLDKTDSQVLVTRDESMTKTVYNKVEKDFNTTWETCSLRQYLNTEFIQKSFSEAERLMINDTKVMASDNPVYGTKGGNNTIDKVFIFDEAELKKYKKRMPNKHYYLRLRTPGRDQTSTMSVSYLGKVEYYGEPANLKVASVRPCMWLALK